MKILFCAYRDWAKRVLPTIEKHPNVTSVRHVTSNEELYAIMQSLVGKNYEAVLFCGWSSPPNKWSVDAIPMFTEHPATSDLFSEGTPLQNQVLNGIRYSKHRLVKVGYPELSLRQFSHEVDIDLSGNMDDITNQMESTSKMLFNQFLDVYPNVDWKEWPVEPETSWYKKRVPDDSKVTKEMLAKLSTEELYDLFRVLESPYPNAYLEDDKGRLYFNKVSFKRKR